MMPTLLVLVLAALDVDGLREGERAARTDELFPGAEPSDDAGPTHLVVRVVDARTGAALPGATLAILAERDEPEPPAWEPLRVARADADGWARLRVDDVRRRFNWVFLSADGHAGAAFFRWPDDPIVELEPGRDVPVEVRGPLDQPLAGAELGLLLGCGHTPDVRHVRTGGDGRAVLPGIALGRGDLWPAHPSLLGQYARVPEAWQPGDPPVVVRGRPGRVVEGEVLHADGRPAVDVPVGQRECHRGPWTRTGAGGRFRLLGADGSSSIEVVVAQGGSRRSLHYELPPAGFFRRLRLPKSADDEPEPREPGRPVKVSTTLANAWGPVAGAEVVAVRLEDGCPTWERTDDAGACTLELAPGRYELLARHPSGEVEPASTELEVSEAGAALAHLMLRPRPKVRLDVQGLPAGGRVALVAEGGERELDGDGRHEPVAVPLGGRRAFRLEAEDRARAFPIAASPPETMTLAWYAPHEVAVAFVDPAGRPTRARAVVAGASGEGLRSAELPPDVEAAERAVVRTTRAGPAFVVAFPEDGRLAPAAARLVLPEGEGKRVDAGTIALELRDAPRLRVQFEDGRPAAGARVELSLVGFSTKDELDAAGAWAALPAPREGDWVVVSDPEGRRVPIRTGLAGPGPWTLRWPEGSLAVEVRGADGRAIEGPAVFLDGETRERSWRGVAPGPHRLIVTAPGRKAYVLDLVWGERDARTIRITLD